MSAKIINLFSLLLLSWCIALLGQNCSQYKNLSKNRPESSDLASKSISTTASVTTNNLESFLLKFTDETDLQNWLTKTTFGKNALKDNAIIEFRNDNSVLIRTTKNKLASYTSSANSVATFIRPPQAIGDRIYYDFDWNSFDPADYAANNKIKMGVKIKSYKEQSSSLSLRKKKSAPILNQLAKKRARVFGNQNIGKRADNSIMPNFPPVGYQGHIGSCTAWAMGYYNNTYSQNLNLENKRTQDNTIGFRNYNQACSPAYIYPLANEGKEGGIESLTLFSVMSQFGCANMDKVPYLSKIENDSEFINWYIYFTQFWAGAIVRENALDSRFDSEKLYEAYSEIDSNQIDEIKALLANGSIGYATFSVYPIFMTYPALESKHNANFEFQFSDEDFSENINNNVYYDNIVSERNPSNFGGHAVALVGYDDNKSYVTTSGKIQKGAFLFVNSFSNNWGIQNPTLCPENNCDETKYERGFFWISYALLQKRILKYYKMSEKAGLLGEILFFKNKYNRSLNEKHSLAMIINPKNRFGYNPITYTVNRIQKQSGLLTADTSNINYFFPAFDGQIRKPIVVDLTEFSNPRIKIQDSRISDVIIMKQGVNVGTYYPDVHTGLIDINSIPN
jgi:hypothetical protein